MTSWRATGECNARCAYCNVDATSARAERELTTKEALRLVDQVYDFGAKWFGLKGGEPLLRKDIFEIVSYAKSKGLNVCLLTNGCFVDGEIYDNLVKNQVWTSVSIDGPEEINDQLRGKGSYQKALAAIQKVSKAGILNGLAAAITSVNYQHLDHVCELADKYHANFVWFNHLVPSGRAKEDNKLTPTPEQYEWVLNHIWDLSLKYEGKFDIHVHCPHYARVVKLRNPPNFDEWYEKRFHGKCTYFAFGGYISVTEHSRGQPHTSLDGHAEIAVLQQLPRPQRPQRQMPRLRVQRNLRRLQEQGVCHDRRHLRGRPRLRLHTQKPSKQVARKVELRRLLCLARC
jgi:MoaA/NifB/PqqE/SkfB family radical SAM enzyme